MDDKLLPVGTIVTIKSDKGKYIISGKNLKIDDSFYDYSLLKYPKGYNDKSKFIYLNDEDLDEVIYLGNINYRT
jgi:hypothetical protein